ncbi:unnamed protein product [Cladocopium goreaui]|uniref:Light-harvesting complex I LH38 protein n=1 Tax=Cladocopium goreaui TaxID=2562237 RepID=A0A9P1GCC6_9DINO|nr:unnamed protein product [Cladocopium goreaui]
MFSMLRCAFAFRRLGSRALPLRAQGQGCSGVPPPPQKVGNSLSSQDSVALFIDGENLSPAVLRPMLKVLEQSSGEILQSRVYIGKHQASFARAAELEGIEQISVPQNGASMKESGDLMLALDAAETCLSGSCKTIAIASEDLDFLILLRKLRSWGCRSILLLPQRPMSRARRLQAAEADHVLCYGEEKIQTESMWIEVPRIRLDTRALETSAEIQEPVPTLRPLLTEHRERQMEELQRVLQELKYLPEPPEQGIMVAALTKFFHVNRLGTLTLWPLHQGLTEAFAALESQAGAWLPNPGDLIFISPRGSGDHRNSMATASTASRSGTRDFAKMATAGGPFLTHAGPQLVEQVLRRLGFLGPGGLDEAIELFCRTNRQALSKSELKESFHSKRDRLHEIFCEQHRLQAWRVAPRCASVTETPAERVGKKVGLFLAHMGGWASILLGSGLAFMLSRGIYLLKLSEVPWAMVFSSSLSSALFNFLIKFGLSRETPVTTSLGTQIGIPLNLLVDVLIVHSHFHWCQAAGVLTMLLSFSVWHHSEAVARKSGDLSVRLLEDGAKSSLSTEPQ